MVINQSYERKYASSPQFQWSNQATIATDGEVRVSWETFNTRSQKYLPFNFTRIVNNSNADITFYPNQDDNNALFIPQGTIQTLDRRSLPALSTFRVLNNSSTNTIATGEIVITNSREGQDADSIVQRTHARLFDKFFGRGRRV